MFNHLNSSKRCWLLTIVTIALVYSSNLVFASSKSEKSLIRYITKQSQGPEGRPVKKATEPMTVKVRLFLSQIINEPDNSITTISYMMMVWEDEFISWNPSQYDGKMMVAVSPTKIWLPDIYSITDNYNNWDDQRRWLKVSQPWVYYNGTVVWAGPFRTRNLCVPKKKYFYQKECTFQLGSLAYSVRDLRLEFLYGDADFVVEDYAETPGIELLSHSAEHVTESYDQPSPNTLYDGLNYKLAVKLSDGAVKRFSKPNKDSGSSQHGKHSFNFRAKKSSSGSSSSGNKS